MSRRDGGPRWCLAARGRRLHTRCALACVLLAGCGAPLRPIAASNPANPSASSGPAPSTHTSLAANEYPEIEASPSPSSAHPKELARNGGTR
jgi:hypothetical protein